MKMKDIFRKLERYLTEYEDGNMNKILPKSQDVRNTLKDLMLDEDKLDASGKPKPDIKFYLAKGIYKQVALDPDKLDDNKLKKITQWKSEMHPKFYKGASFMDMTTDINGVKWSEELSDADNLLILLKFTGYAEIMTNTPSVFLPGHVPYIKIYKNRKPIDTVSMRELRALGIGQ